MRIELTFAGHAHGWAELRLDDGRRMRAIVVSYLFDTLGDFVRAMAAAFAHVGAHAIRATDESDDVLITVRRLERELEIVVKRRLSTGAGNEWKDWKTLVRLRGGVDELKTAFCTGWRSLIDEVGPDGYAARWGHPFPRAEWAALERQAQ